MNTPVIASKTGAIPELFQNNKQFLFEPNKDSLADILTKILDKPKTSLSTFDFKISDKYLIEKTASTYVNLYKGLLK
jgi:glycosyltransferase involved in cell wall biosynthesis